MQDNAILFINGIDHVAVTVKQGRCHQGPVVIKASDIRDVQGQEPGQAGTDENGDRATDDQEKCDDVVVAASSAANRFFPGRFFRRSFSGCHGRFKKIPVEVYGCDCRTRIV